MSREDLSLPTQAVQCGHALLEATRAGYIPNDIQHPNFVYLSSKNERYLLSLYESLKSKGIDCVFFVEPDLDNQITAFATAPLSGKERRLLRALPLLREVAA